MWPLCVLLLLLLCTSLCCWTIYYVSFVRAVKIHLDLRNGALLFGHNGTCARLHTALRFRFLSWLLWNKIAVAAKLLLGVLKNIIYKWLCADKDSGAGGKWWSIVLLFFFPILSYSLSNSRLIWYPCGGIPCLCTTRFGRVANSWYQSTWTTCDNLLKLAFTSNKQSECNSFLCDITPRALIMTVYLYSSRLMKHATFILRIVMWLITYTQIRCHYFPFLIATDNRE